MGTTIRRLCVISIAGGCGVLVWWTGVLEPWSGFAILSGSMEPTLPIGSFVVVSRLPHTELQVGDIIAIRSPSTSGHVVIHRITRTYTVGQTDLVETKGDANTNGDSWKVSRGEIIGNVRWCVPYLGFLGPAIRSRCGFLTLATILLVLMLSLVFPNPVRITSSNNRV